LSVRVHTVDEHNPASQVPIPFEGRFIFGHRPIVQHLTGENILYEYIRHRLTVGVFVVCFLPEIKGGSRYLIGGRV